MTNDTRTDLLDTAETLFAERGFYGVSIAAIAAERGLTKQALLHHFGSKEKLYGAVLERISQQLDTLQKERTQITTGPEIAIVQHFMRIFDWSTLHPLRTRLLMRELLDNKARAEAASTWYLKPFLDDLVARLKRLPNWASAPESQALAAIYQLLGAINYFAISGPTLAGIFGQDAYTHLSIAFPQQLKLLIHAHLATAPVTQPL